APRGSTRATAARAAPAEGCAGSGRACAGTRAELSGHC
ncbi:MAG: hypothetical protein AVDCRST_MAG93-1817, partial [uncultured Chloroflexia bacterium]